MTPSDPDTMMTALTQAQHRTHKTGQEFVVFTCDLQLYRVALHVLWTYPDRFPNVIWYVLIDKSSLCGGSGFPFSLSEWSLTICLRHITVDKMC